MPQKQEQRTSPSPYIHKVWRSTALTDGIYLATPDGSWDLITATKADGSRLIYITGQASQPSRLPYKKGEQSVVIQFVAGAYLIPFRGAPFTNSFTMLTMPNQDHFELAGDVIPFTYF